MVSQRYDVKLGATAETPILRWEGTADPRRVVALRVWDPAGQKWVVLTSSRGQAGQSTVLTAPLTPVHRDGGTVHVLVTAGTAPVSGTVELREGTTMRGSATFSGGTATFTLPVGLAGGAHPLTASYSGSEHLDPAQATGTVTVKLPPAWSATEVYHRGDRVSFQGRIFLAYWYAENQKPADPSGPWQELAMTEQGVTFWTASRIFNSGDVVTYGGKIFRARWYSRNQAPGDPNGPVETD
ncbi:Ig-like domain repeat protein [Plantactinospora sp. KLBMP9567]|uniref:Ig-like domain repeat protein n=1 Tax=Plantactinospora sp. KLBMP9567 TaxID=3085900 RepID=UPI002982A3EF|nr:Ig-like domain repeat protein [Plantactinospora sp. KLBMP9567]MDW5327483.1 Ig-like domain repeat protein [Plantactinospora sp. KLBMP9567]